MRASTIICGQVGRDRARGACALSLRWSARRCDFLVCGAFVLAERQSSRSWSAQRTSYEMPTAMRAERARRRTRVASRTKTRGIRPASRRASRSHESTRKRHDKPHDADFDACHAHCEIQHRAANGARCSFITSSRRLECLPYCDFVEQQTVALQEVRARPDMTVNLPGRALRFRRRQGAPRRDAERRLKRPTRQPASGSSSNTRAPCATTSILSHAAAIRPRKARQISW